MDQELKAALERMEKLLSEMRDSLRYLAQKEQAKDRYLQQVARDLPRMP